jgi:membrane protease YdiL (CAAX protease family)
VIQARLAAPRRAAALTALLLGAAMLRALLMPGGDLPSTAVFAAALLAIIRLDGWPAAIEDRWGRGRSLVAGLVVGGVLLVPGVLGAVSARPLDGFWGWAAIAAGIAVLEEITIRGVLYRRWLEEAGPLAAVITTSVVFALIHLPRYGLSAMPLDLSVGLALGGLRALTGRILPCAVAHTIADWGAWLWP